MVIVQIRSGLGNQMFQYAFARQLALKNDTKLRLDLSFYESYPLRKYELDSLSIEAQELTSIEKLVFRTALTQRFPTLRFIAERLLGGNLTLLRDCQKGFEQEVFDVCGNIYLQGFWQSWKYFADIRPLLLKEFNVSLPCSDLDNSSMAEIERSQSVCIHVRRGDYVNDPKTSETFGACAFDYYLDAIRYIAERIEDPTYFVFSDDPVWAKEHFGDGEKFNYVMRDDRRRPARDLRLMQCCKHFILSNSTFGWWAAWLSRTPNKIVVSPKFWYKMHSTSQDLLPPDWILLPNGLT
jgi:hypothetical protein